MSTPPTRAQQQSDYRRFQSQAPLLYDFVMSYGLTWPCLSAQWLPVEPQRRDGGITHQMLIGTYTEEGFANYIQLANVTMPDRATADPMEQFLSHPIARPLRSAHAAASSQQAASASAASSAAASTTAKPAPAAAASVDEFSGDASPPTHFLSQGSLRLVHKVRASQELHRIRPFAPSFTSNMSGGSLLNPVHDEDEGVNDGDEAMNGARISSSSASCQYSLALAAAKGPDSEVRIYDVGRGAHPTAAMSDAALCGSRARDISAGGGGGGGANGRRGGRGSVALIPRSSTAKQRDKDEGLLTLVGHEVGGWALDWNHGPGTASEGLLVSGDDEGGICVWRLQDAQESAAVMFRAQNGTRSAASTAASAINGVTPTLAMPLAGSPMQRLQAQSSTTASSSSSAPLRSSSAPVARAPVPTLSPHAQWHSAHVGTINDIAWLKCGSPSVFLTVGDDHTLKEWDIRHDRREAAVVSTVVHDQTVNSVATSPFNEHLVLTGGDDCVVRMWDRRNMKDLTPLHTYSGHGDCVTQVSWAPFETSRSASSARGGVFASSAKDRRIFLWDPSCVEGDANDVAESGPPELMFVHAGHTDLVEDFHWHPSVPWLMSSVGSCGENVLQVWEMFEGLHIDLDVDREGDDTQLADLVSGMEPFSKLLQTQASGQGAALDLEAIVAAETQVSSSLATNSKVRKCMDPTSSSASSSTASSVAQFVAGYERKLRRKLEQVGTEVLKADTKAAPELEADDTETEGVAASAATAGAAAAATSSSSRSRHGLKRRAASSSSPSPSSSSEPSRSPSPTPVEVKLKPEILKKQQAKQQQQQHHQSAVKAEPARRAPTRAASNGGTAAAPKATPFSQLPPWWQQRLLDVRRAREDLRSGTKGNEGGGRTAPALQSALLDSLDALLAEVSDGSAAPAAVTKPAAARTAAAAHASKPGPAKKARLAANSSSSSSSDGSDSDSESDGELLVSPAAVAAASKARKRGGGAVSNGTAESASPSKRAKVDVRPPVAAAAVSPAAAASSRPLSRRELKSLAEGPPGLAHQLHPQTTYTIKEVNSESGLLLITRTVPSHLNTLRKQLSDTRRADKARKRLEEWKQRRRPSNERGSEAAAVDTGITQTDVDMSLSAAAPPLDSTSTDPPSAAIPDALVATSVAYTDTSMELASPPAAVSAAAVVPTHPAPLPVPLPLPAVKAEPAAVTTVDTEERKETHVQGV